MSDARVSVHKVEPGSIVVFHGVDFGQARSDEVAEAIAQAVDHSRFVLVALPVDGGEVEVWGPDDDLAEKVRALLDSLP